MNAQTDQQLLRDYAGSHSDAAFAELVRRHIDLVYSAALRMVCDSHQAEDLTQGVFVALAQNARRLTHHPVLSGWLHRTTQNLAANAVRATVRRQTREQEAVVMNELLSAEPDASWENIAPHLDAALGELSEPDRDALLLRYFERKSAREMAQILGISDEAAQKRLSRAVERLREFFTKRGVTVGASGLVLVISANAVQAAPGGLAVCISTAAALAGATLTATIATQTAATTMNWLNIKSIATVVVAAVLAGTGTHLIQQREATRLRNENQSLIVEGEKLTYERDTSLAAVAANNNELERLQKNQIELLRLRGEVGQMRRQLELQKAQSNPPPPATQRETSNTVSHPPGSYISKDQLAFAGYATPETALETITWTMMNGTYDQVNEGLGPALLAEELKDEKSRAAFEAQQKIMAPLFKGIQIVARKVLADDKVELKVKMDAEPIPNQERKMPPFMIQPMVKDGDVWKIGGSTRGHQATWESNGQIQTYAP